MYPFLIGHSMSILQPRVSMLTSYCVCMKNTVVVVVVRDLLW